MTDQREDHEGPAAAMPGEQRWPAGRSERLLGLAVAVVLLVSVGAGVLIAHELRAGSHRATAPGGGGSPVTAAVERALVDIGVSFGYDGSAGAASGIVVSPDGEVLTNNHVIDGATAITATDVGNGRTYKATVVGYAPGLDLAVLQLQGASGLATVKTGGSSKLVVGEAVLGIGNAGGAGGTPEVVRARSPHSTSPSSRPTIPESRPNRSRG